MSNLDNERQTRESVERLAEVAAKKAVESVFVHLGIDIADPIKAQEQFAALRKLSALMDDKEFAADFEWLRRLRIATESARDVSLRTIVRIVVTAIIGLVVLGTKDWWLSHITLNLK